MPYTIDSKQVNRGSIADSSAASVSDSGQQSEIHGQVPGSYREGINRWLENPLRHEQISLGIRTHYHSRDYVAHLSKELGDITENVYGYSGSTDRGGNVGNSSSDASTGRGNELGKTKADPPKIKPTKFASSGAGS